MSFGQKLLMAIVPRRWADEMEAESRSWMLHCNVCGLERSVWEMGGVRWKAAGRPSRLMYCPQCGKTTWHKLYRRQGEEHDGSGPAASLQPEEGAGSDQQAGDRS
jgi:hypothetical protein